MALPGFGRKLGIREKAWALAWLVVVGGIVEFRMLVAPRRGQLKEVTQQISGLEKEKAMLQAQAPDLTKKQAQINGLKKEIVEAFEKLQEAEKDLLDVQDVDTLLESLVKDRGRFQMVLNSIRPVQEKAPSTVEAREGDEAKAGDPYRKLRVQIDAYATFQGMVDYIAFLEKMRPYQEVEGIKVKVEGKEYSKPHLLVMVSVLMGEQIQTREKGFKPKEIFSSLEEQIPKQMKDPFLTGERPKELLPAAGMSLSGVFSEGGKPVAAMINNDIYRVGDLIDGKRIVAIEPTRVFLEAGNQRYLLEASEGRAQ